MRVCNAVRGPRRVTRLVQRDDGGMPRTLLVRRGDGMVWPGADLTSADVRRSVARVPAMAVKMRDGRGA